MAMENLPADACRTCRHFWVTWRPGYPYGCRAFQMVTAGMPLLHVRRDSGQDCLYFERRPPPAGKTPETPRKRDGGGGWLA